MTEPTKREVELVQEFADWLQEHAHDSFPVDDIWYRQLEQRIADYREKLLAASAQSAEPQEGSLERMLNHVSRLLHYDDGRPAYTQMIEAARLIDAERAALARLASKPSSSEDVLDRLRHLTPGGSEFQTADECFVWLEKKLASRPARPSREEEMREQIERIKHDCENALRSSKHHKCDYLSLIQSINDRLARAALAQGGARDEGEGR